LGRPRDREPVPGRKLLNIISHGWEPHLGPAFVQLKKILKRIGYEPTVYYGELTPVSLRLPQVNEHSIGEECEILLREIARLRAGGEHRQKLSLPASV
jgi:hypothetical protein